MDDVLFTDSSVVIAILGGIAIAVGAEVNIPRRTLALLDSKLCHLSKHEAIAEPNTTCSLHAAGGLTATTGCLLGDRRGFTPSDLLLRDLLTVQDFDPEGVHGINSSFGTLRFGGRGNELKPSVDDLALIIPPELRPVGEGFELDDFEQIRIAALLRKADKQRAVVLPQFTAVDRQHGGLQLGVVGHNRTTLTRDSRRRKAGNDDQHQTDTFLGTHSVFNPKKS